MTGQATQTQRDICAAMGLDPTAANMAAVRGYWTIIEPFKEVADSTSELQAVVSLDAGGGFLLQSICAVDYTLF